MTEMEQYHKILQALPADMYQQKADHLIKTTKQYLMGKFDHTCLQRSEPKINKVLKACAEYIEVAMSSYKQFEFSKNPIDVEEIEQKEDLRANVYEIRVTALNFNIRHNGKLHRLNLIVADDDTLSSIYNQNGDLSSIEKIVDSGLILRLQDTVKRVNELLNTAVLHTCSNLYLTGKWFVTSDLRDLIYGWLLFEGEESFENLTIKELERIVNSSISDKAEVEIFLSKEGGNSHDSPFPCFSFLIYKDNGNQRESVLFPSRTSLGWQHNIISEQNNIGEAILSDLDYMSLGVNNLIDNLKKEVEQSVKSKIGSSQSTTVS